MSVFGPKPLQIIGPDAQGRHPHHPDRRPPDMSKSPAHHEPAPARGMEAQQHAKAILGKPGRAKGYPVAIAAGQHHVADGVFNAGVSRTESAAALQGDKLPTDPPVVGKKLPTPAVSWGCKSVGAEQHDASGAQARKILTDAYEASGPDHPHNLARRLPDATSENTDSGAAAAAAGRP